MGEEGDVPEPEGVPSGGGADSWSTESAARLLDHLVQAGVAELDQPHVVICTDTETGARTYLGPFPNALTAAAAAQRDHDVWVAERLHGDDRVDRLRFDVAPLQADDPPPVPRDGS